MALGFAIALGGDIARKWRVSGCVVGLLALMGCAVTHKVVTKQPGPPVPSYHQPGGGVPIRRVAMLPLSYETGDTAVPRSLDGMFNAELTKTSLFELILINRSQMQEMFGTPQLSSVDVLPGDLLSQLMTRYNVDAVLFTDITQYFPYQPVSIGLRSKLVDARTGEIRWAFDYLFDSGKPSVAQDAKTYFLQNSQTNLPIPVDGSSILVSPLRFSRFAAWQAYRSLIKQPPTQGNIDLKSSNNPPM